MAVPALHDFAALLMAFLIIVESKATLVHTIEDLEDFLNRFKKHSDYYSSNSDITKTFIFLKKSLTILKKSYIIILMFKSHSLWLKRGNVRVIPFVVY